MNSMKKTLMMIGALLCANVGFSQDIIVDKKDSIRVIVPLAEVIRKQESDYDNVHRNEHYRKVWGRNTYFNISYNSTTKETSQLPLKSKPEGTEKFDSNISLGLQWGHTYNFHARPIGKVLFMGLDYTWMDFNFHKYKSQSPFSWYKEGEPIGQDKEGESFYAMPWHNEKYEGEYGMSFGPSLTLYPFTTLGLKGTDEIRVQLYYHIGYGAGMTFISDVPTNPTKPSSSDTQIELAWYHGLIMSFGANITWKFVGVGYESRKASNLQSKNFSHKFNMETSKFSQTINRFYLQFRF